MDHDQPQHRPRAIDLALLRLVVEGLTDPLDIGVPQRLTILRARYGSSPIAGPLVHRAWVVLLRANEHAEEAADRAYLESLIDGSGELLSEGTFPRMEPMFTKYPEGSHMLALVEKVAEMFSDAVQQVACWAIAGIAIEQAQRSAGEDGPDRHEY